MNAKLVILLFGTLIAVVSCAVLGGSSNSNNAETAELVATDLSKLAQCGGPQYKLNKIISANKSVVSGLLYKLVLEVIDANKCIVNCAAQIWSKPWGKIEQITLDCEGSAKVVKNLYTC